MTLNVDAKFKGKLTFDFKNDMKNLESFHQSTWNSQNWDFDGILLSKVENVWGRKLFVMTIKNGAKLEEELTYRFKTDVRNLTNFDPSTRKSQKCTL